MIKTVIKVALAVAVLNAAFRGSQVAWRYYEFRDETQQLLIFAGNASIPDLHNRIMQRAVEMEVPLEAANLTVRRDGQRTVAAAAYDTSVEYFPNQRYPLSLSFTVDALSLQAVTSGPASN